jgi:ABC-type glycerol-3-phosphate transport system permease component
MQQTRSARAETDLVSLGGTVVRKLITRGPLYLVIIFLSALFAFPFFWTVSSSLKTVQEWHVYPPAWLPASPQWGNYREVFTLMRYPIGRWIFNTVFIAFMSTSGAILSASIVAYSFARFRFRGRDFLFMVTLATMMLPSQVTLIPTFLLFNKIDWVDTSRPLWVGSWFGGGAFNIFLLRQFFMTIPREMDEAAKIDGAGYFRIFWQLIMPLSRPVLATVTIIAMMANWNSFLGPLVYLNSTERFTIALGLRFFNTYKDQAAMKPLEHLLMAATTMSIMPTILLFFSGQRYFVRGIVMTGIKG